ncbi:MAG: hypothetical protein C4520_09170 [Candidatus Abyssobacteria bacterium SURF_5]|uniref:Secreted protein n=1 Tax=Abyssobacteria bacterium (strain SURF_5) TaxID=2093360 RepID=A0A3A4NMW6_ABYX5|nr:MAG: hypothetical protein C4520_09170 [Candidatus Abyssubacteria bacterium SURF_5]
MIGRCTLLKFYLVFVLSLASLVSVGCAHAQTAPDSLPPEPIEIETPVEGEILLVLSSDISLPLPAEMEESASSGNNLSSPGSR